MRLLLLLLLPLEVQNYSAKNYTSVRFIFPSPNTTDSSIVFSELSAWSGEEKLLLEEENQEILMELLHDDMKEAIEKQEMKGWGSKILDEGSLDEGNDELSGEGNLTNKTTGETGRERKDFLRASKNQEDLVKEGVRVIGVGETEETSENKEKEEQTGKSCVTKVVLEEVPNFDNTQSCQHFYRHRCHQTFITAYTPQQIEKCEDSYIKTCFITFEKIASKVVIETCQPSLTKICQVGQEPECRRFFRTECSSTQFTQEGGEEGCTSDCTLEKQSVIKYQPQASCKKVEFDLCTSHGCRLLEGPTSCKNESKTIVQQLPVEDCKLEPRQTCRLETKLIPHLDPSETCVEVPYEVCTRLTKQGTVLRPLIRKWCYTPGNI